VVQLDQARHLLDAWRAPRRPEVEQYHLATIAGEVNRGLASETVKSGARLPAFQVSAASQPGTAASKVLRGGDVEERTYL